MQTISFPSKTFLLGEYAVINEGVALMLAHGPSFSAEILPTPAHKPAFAAGCAAGKAAEALGVDLRRLTFSDPHGGKGGFGGSGAEFLSVLAAKKIEVKGEAFAWGAWDLYHRLECTGSGADILTQGAAEVGQVVSLKIRARKIELFSSGTLGITVNLFHTGHKLPTHQHLQNAGKLDTSSLAQIVVAGDQALRQKNSAAFLSCIKDYAAELARINLVASHTAKALRALEGQREVLAAKGCGALGSDVILVCTAGASPALSPWASHHSLVEVASLSI